MKKLLIISLLAFNTFANIEIISGFDVFAQSPVDSRTVAENLTAVSNLASIVRYDGLMIYVQDVAKIYQFSGGIANSDLTEFSGGGGYPLDIQANSLTLPDKGKIWLTAQDARTNSCIYHDLTNIIFWSSRYVSATEVDTNILVFPFGTADTSTPAFVTAEETTNIIESIVELVYITNKIDDIYATELQLIGATNNIEKVDLGFSNDYTRLSIFNASNSWFEVTKQITGDYSTVSQLIGATNHIAGGSVNWETVTNIADNACVDKLDRDGDVAGSLTITNATILNAESLPWGTVARYSGENVYFTNSVWASLKDAIDDDKIIINGDFIENQTDITYDSSPMTSARNNITIVGIGKSVINVTITNRASANECAMDLSAITNLILDNINIKAVYENDNNSGKYLLWLNACYNLNINNCTFQGEVYGTNNIFKNFVATAGATNINVRNTRFLTIDVTGSNCVYHGATHDAENSNFNTCYFIGTGNNYMVGGASYNNCYGNVIVGNRVLPINARLAKSFIIGTTAEINFLNGLLPKLTSNTTSGNFNEYGYLGAKVFIIKPEFDYIHNVCGNVLSHIPNNYDGTVYLYGGIYDWITIADNWDNVDFEMIGIGSPSIIGGGSFDAMFKNCSNSTFKIKNIDCRTVVNGRCWPYGQRYNYSSTVEVYNCNVDFRSSDEIHCGVAPAPNCTDSAGFVYGGSIISPAGLGYSYQKQYNYDVKTYTNNYQLPTGTLNNNVLSLDAFGQKVVNVTAGTESMDAVNVSQLIEITNSCLQVSNQVFAMANKGYAYWEDNTGTNVYISTKLTNVSEIVFADGSSISTGGSLHVSSDLIVEEKLGIGTTSPGAKLEVVGDIISEGTAWTARTSPVDNDWRSVTYGNGMFVAVARTGAGNRVMTSPDGVNWTARASAVDNMWRSVTYGNGIFVAVANSGSGNRVMTSPDGINWTTQTSAADNEWFSVTYGNGIFVAVANTGVGNRVMTSPDGINWTSRTSAVDNGWLSVTYGNGMFVAVAFSGTGNRVMTSPDGINWTTQTSAADNEWYAVTYGNGMFVAVGITGTGNRVMTSPDGVNWTSRASAIDNGWLAVTYGNGIFVTVAYTGAGNRIMTSGKAKLDITQHQNQFNGGMTITDALNLKPVSAAPTAPEAGDMYYDSDDNKLKCYNGTTWNNCF